MCRIFGTPICLRTFSFTVYAWTDTIFVSGHGSDAAKMFLEDSATKESSNGSCSCGDDVDEG